MQSRDLCSGTGFLRELKLCCFTFKVKGASWRFAVITLLLDRMVSGDKTQFQKCPEGTTM